MAKRSTRQPSKQQRKRMQDELVEKLPDTTEPSQEWGDRMSTGKAVASGGKKGGRHTKPGEPASGEKG